MRKPSSSSYSSPPDASKPDLACRPHARRLHESPQIKCMSADDGYSHLGGHTGSKEAEGIKEKDENGAERRPKNAPADVHRKTASKWTRTRVLVGRAEPGENSLLFGKRFIPK